MGWALTVASLRLCAIFSAVAVSVQLSCFWLCTDWGVLCVCVFVWCACCAELCALATGVFTCVGVLWMSELG